MTAIGTLYNVTWDHLQLNGQTTGNVPNALGGIKYGESRMVSIHDNSIKGFTGSGIQQTSSNFGQGSQIYNNDIQSYVGSGTLTSSSYCVNLAGGDNYVIGGILGDCETLVYLGNGNNTVSHVHLWKFSFADLTGIVANVAQKLRITDNYIDTVQTVLKGAASGYHFNSNVISGNLFYMPPTGTGGSSSFSSAKGAAFIVYMPTVSNSGVYQDNISGNAFSSDNGQGGLTIATNTASGSIASGSIAGVNITGNTAYGVTLQTSRPWCHITITSAASGSCTMSNVPFGTINTLRGSSAAFMYTPVNWWLTGTPGSTITANLSSSTSVQINVEGSINTDYVN